MMTPSFTDHNSLCPSQPSRSLPLKSLIVSDLPVLGGISGALVSAFFSWAVSTRSVGEHSRKGPTERASADASKELRVMGGSFRLRCKAETQNDRGAVSIARMIGLQHDCEQATGSSPPLTKDLTKGGWGRSVGGLPG